MRRIIITLAVLGAIGFVGYKAFASGDYWSKLDFKPVGHKLTINTLTSADIDVMIDVTSRLKTDITVTGYNVDLDINGSEIAHLVSDVRQMIKHGGKVTFTLSADFDPRAVIKNITNPLLIKQAFDDLSKILIGINGSVGIEAFNIDIPYLPLHLSFPLSSFVPQQNPPKLGSDGIYNGIPILPTRRINEYYSHADGNVFETWLQTGVIE